MTQLLVATYRLGLFGIFALKPSQTKRSARYSSLSIAFLSIDGIKCNLHIFRGKTHLSSDISPLLLEGHLRRELRDSLCNCTLHCIPWRFQHALAGKALNPNFLLFLYYVISNVKCFSKLNLDSNIGGICFSRHFGWISRSHSRDHEVYCLLM